MSQEEAAYFLLTEKVPLCGFGNRLGYVKQSLSDLTDDEKLMVAYVLYYCNSHFGIHFRIVDEFLWVHPTNPTKTVHFGIPTSTSNEADVFEVKNIRDIILNVEFCEKTTKTDQLVLSFRMFINEADFDADLKAFLRVPQSPESILSMGLVNMPYAFDNLFFHPAFVARYQGLSSSYPADTILSPYLKDHRKPLLLDQESQREMGVKLKALGTEWAAMYAEFGAYKTFMDVKIKDAAFLAVKRAEIANLLSNTLKQLEATASGSLVDLDTALNNFTLLEAAAVTYNIKYVYDALRARLEQKIADAKQAAGPDAALKLTIQAIEKMEQDLAAPNITLLDRMQGLQAILENQINGAVTTGVSDLTAWNDVVNRVTQAYASAKTAYADDVMQNVNNQFDNIGITIYADAVDHTKDYEAVKSKYFSVLDNVDVFLSVYGNHKIPAASLEAFRKKVENRINDMDAYINDEPERVARLQANAYWKQVLAEWNALDQYDVTSAEFVKALTTDIPAGVLNESALTTAKTELLNRFITSSDAFNKANVPALDLAQLNAAEKELDVRLRIIDKVGSMDVLKTSLEATKQRIVDARDNYNYWYALDIKWSGVIGNMDLVKAAPYVAEINASNFDDIVNLQLRNIVSDDAREVLRQYEEESKKGKKQPLTLREKLGISPTMTIDQMPDDLKRIVLLNDNKNNF